MKKLIFFLLGSLLMVHTIFGQDEVEPSIELNKIKNAVDALFIIEQTVTEVDQKTSIDAAVPLSKYTEILASRKLLDSLKSFSYKFGIGFQPAPLVNANIVTYEAIYKANSKTLKIYEIERSFKVTPGYGTITQPSKYWDGFQIGFNLGQVCENKMKTLEREFLIELQRNREDSTWRKGKIAAIRAEEIAAAKAKAQKEKAEAEAKAQKEKAEAEYQVHVEAKRKKQYDDFLLNNYPTIKEASLTWEEGDKIRLFDWNGFYESSITTIAFFEKYNDTKTKAKLLINESSGYKSSYQGIELKKNDYIWIDIPTQFETKVDGSLVTFYYWKKG